MDFVINMRICLLVIANYVYRANCRQHHWHNKRPKNPPTTRTVAPDAQLQSASKCKRSKPSTKTRHHSLPMDWTSILVRHFCRRIFCCTFPLRCIIWPLGCMKDSIERQRRPTCRSESQPVPPGVVDSVVVAMPWLACSVRDSEKCEFCLSGHSSVRQLGLTQRLLLLLFGGATECGRGGSHNDSHVCVVFWCTHCNCNWMTDGRRLKKEETNYIAFLETAQGG